jgi:UDP-N-acetylglucosamine acyltransferase
MGMKNEIHATAILENVSLGSGNKIGPGCVIRNAVIGNRNTFTAYCCIGEEAQHLTADKDLGVCIGNDNTFREFATVHGGTVKATRIGTGNYFMQNSHVAHDCDIGNSNVLCGGVQLAGHVSLLNGIRISAASILFQRIVVGSYSFFSMGSLVTKDVRPYRKVIGNRDVGVNNVILSSMAVAASYAESLDSEEYLQWQLKCRSRS